MAEPVVSQQIRKIQAASTIREVAGMLGMGVVRRGAATLCVCPFHADTSPSLTLYDQQDQKSHYHCYVCGAHGDVFSLVQHVRNVSFPEAVSWLAAQYGFSDGRSPQQVDPEIAKASAREHGLNVALEVFRENSDLDLLHEFLTGRALSRQVSADLEIVAIRGRLLSRYVRSLQSEGKNWREVQGYLDAAGLIRSNVVAASTTNSLRIDIASELQDFFYDDRIIFPLRDGRGRVVGFAGRRVESATSSSNKDRPKYLYSPGTPRGSILYRQKEALEVVRNGAGSNSSLGLSVVEGLMDVARLTACGIPAVALLGSQPTREQCDLLKEIVDQSSSDREIPLHIFLDRDAAGIRGSVKTVSELNQRGIAASFVWPTRHQLKACGVQFESKDPDEILRNLTQELAAEEYRNWIHPAVLPLLAEQLGLAPDEVLDSRTWEAVSRTRRQRAISEIVLRLNDANIILEPASSEYSARNEWLGFVSKHLLPGPFVGGNSRSEQFDENARLNLARSLACSGVQRGDMAPDLATWRRLDLVATAVNEAITSRFQQKDLGSLEPFDSMYVSRGFGKKDHRLKVMPCPEDLICQQYLMNAVLTETNDCRHPNGSFSSHIPAVRFYREGNRTNTTDSGRTEIGAVSFAYQVDMDVLEGRVPAAGNGIFRPYFHCWRDFIGYLRRSSERMSRVHVLRLDVRRYYDELTRGVIRDHLKHSFSNASRTLDDQAAQRWASLLPAAGGPSQRAELIVDWICDQSFGYSYFEPEAGEVRTAPLELGIPQGPMLSAWLGSVALFPLDRVMREVVNELNEGREVGEQTAAYARYVDDLVLVADSPERLAVMRGRAEDVVRRLSLTLVQKADPVPAMSAQEFGEFLTEGRAFATSEPDAEPIIFGAGDGEAGWQMLGWAQDDVHRKTSLHLLHDKRLYDVDFDQAVDHLYTALRADELRPKDLAKAARWLWLHSAIRARRDRDGADIWSIYRQAWISITRGSVWSAADAECAWEDPALYALEGLEKLLDFPQGQDPLTQSRPDLISAVRFVAERVITAEFLREFQAQGPDSAVDSWGVGASRLRRMFWNHALPLRMKAVRILGSDTDRVVAEQLDHSQRDQIKALKGSLNRALITNAEAMEEIDSLPAQNVSSGNPLAIGLLWLHCAAVRFGARQFSDAQSDPLDGSILPFVDLRKADQIFQVASDRFLPSLQLIQPGERASEDQGVNKLALATLSAVSNRRQFAAVIARRRLLFAATLGAIPFPVLPGIVPNELLLISVDAANLERGFAAAHELKLLQFERVPIGSDWIPCLVSKQDEVEIQRFSLQWNADSALEELGSLALSTADISNLGLGVFLKPPNVGVDKQSLAFAADLFEAIALLNSVETGDEERNEYVPAWPFIAFENERLESSVVGERRFALVCFPVRASALGNLAFVRAGTRGLQPVTIPSESAHLWRAGVTVSDLLGLGDDVDRYQRNLDSSSAHSSLDKEVLIQSMRRLRGCHVRPGYLRKDKRKPHLPATISRVLTGMREYAALVDPRRATSFVLGLRAESVAMAIRLDQSGVASGSGSTAAFIEKVARATVSSVPPKYLEGVEFEGISGGVLRQTVLGWSILERRIRAMPHPDVGHLDRAWRGLACGLSICAITSSLRSIAFELAADDRRRSKWSADLVADVASYWAVEDACLVGPRVDADPRTLTLQFIESFGGTAQRARLLFDDITPVGWLAIIADMLGFFARDETRAFSFKGQDGAANLIRLENSVAQLATMLGVGGNFSSSSSSGNEDWPFEDIEGLVDALESEATTTASEAITLLDDFCGYNVVKVSGKRWPYNLSSNTFTDSRGNDVPLIGWQVQFLGDGPTWSQSNKGRFVTTWTETRRSDDKLLGVSVWRKSFGDLIGKDSRSGGVLQLPMGTTSGRDQTPRESRPIEPQNGTANSGAVYAVNDIGVKPDSDPSPLDPIREAPASDQRSVAQATLVEVRSKLRELQSQTWKAREKKSSSQVRVALLQWQVTDSYVHPIFDIPLDKGLEEEVFGSAAASSFEKRRLIYGQSMSAGQAVQHDGSSNEARCFAQAAASSMERAPFWNDARQIESWVEHRRRRLIRECVDSCHKLGVDVLVLPEYSVRPDTVSWIADYVKANGIEVSIYAGTYRLFGDSSVAGFDAAFAEAFGTTDSLTVLAAKESRDRIVSNGERSAFLSFIVPIRSSLSRFERGAVSIFTRRKRYPAAAANEVFNPGTNPWAPLYTLRAATEDLRHRSSDGRRSRLPQDPVTGLEMVQMAANHMPEQFCAELICSEIFLATSPANTRTIAEQYQELAARFGENLSMKEAIDKVEADIHELSRVLGHGASVDRGASEVSLLRRTILIVPAMTSRSADYWNFGQAGLLAAGLTTVFCNASHHKYSVGHSCVIGASSWKSEKVDPGLHAHVTPYSGWSRGIYYTQEADALGRKEQALVVVDIDPVYMTEGKPRPQTLRPPLQLVAHLPIIESVVGLATSLGSQAAQRVTNAYPIFRTQDVGRRIGELLTVADEVPKTSFWDPKFVGSGGSSLIDSAVEVSKFTEDSNAFEGRLLHWGRHWRDLPWANLPPAVFDFIWVDHSLEGRESVATVFVPPWAS